LIQLKLIVEAQNLVRMFSLSKHASTQGYLIYCQPKERSEDLNSNEWDGRMNAIKKEISKLKTHINEQVSSFCREISNKNEVRFQLILFDERINTLTEEMKSLMK
jgi:hypothetical protein